jgi:hypothetical protein
MSMKSSARNSAKAKARRLCGVQTGKVDASGWKQPYASKTPSARRAYAAGGKVGCDGDKDDKYVGEVEKEAGVKKRADKRPRKMDGGPTVGTGDPREFANAMMQGAPTARRSLARTRFRPTRQLASRSPRCAAASRRAARSLRSSRSRATRRTIRSRK